MLGFSIEEGAITVHGKCSVVLGPSDAVIAGLPRVDNKAEHGIILP
jgi:hypothetical protein